MKVNYDDKDLNLALYRIEELEDNYNQIANECVNFYIDSFNNQGFTDYSFTPWEKSLKNNGATLVLTGNLRNSIRATNVTRNGFTIESNTPYSRIHNEGGTIPITDKMKKFFLSQGISKKNSNKRESNMFFKLAHSNGSITIPKRQFMGESNTLNNQITDYIIRYF